MVILACLCVAGLAVPAWVITGRSGPRPLAARFALAVGLVVAQASTIVVVIARTFDLTSGTIAAGTLLVAVPILEMIRRTESSGAEAPPRLIDVVAVGALVTVVAAGLSIGRSHGGGVDHAIVEIGHWLAAARVPPARFADVGAVTTSTGAGAWAATLGGAAGVGILAALWLVAVGIAVLWMCRVARVDHRRAATAAMVTIAVGAAAVHLGGALGAGALALLAGAVASAADLHARSARPPWRASRAIRVSELPEVDRSAPRRNGDAHRFPRYVAGRSDRAAADLVAVWIVFAALGATPLALVTVPVSIVATRRLVPVVASGGQVPAPTSQRWWSRSCTKYRVRDSTVNAEPSLR